MKGFDTMGEKVQFETGATRSATPAGSKGKPVRYDLISPIALRRLAETYAEGAEIHGARNWEKGLPIWDCLSRALAHISTYCGGDRSEDHLAHAVFGLCASMHFEESPAAMDSRSWEAVVPVEPSPCPACGLTLQEGATYEHETSTGNDWTKVLCPKCGMTGPYGDDEKMAIVLWNDIPRVKE